MTPNIGGNVLGYARVSTSEQAENGHGLAAQELAIRQECAKRGWRVDQVLREAGSSAQSLDRPVLKSALDAIAAGEVIGLVASKLDRLTRSVVDFGTLLEWFSDCDATLVAVDVGIDTSSPGGKLVAQVFAAVAEWERDAIAARTKEGLAAARASGRAIGRPAVADDAKLLRRIQEMRGRGLTLQAISNKLNADGVPTLRGGREWRPSSVQSAAGYARRKPRRKAPELPDIGRRRAVGAPRA